MEKSNSCSKPPTRYCMFIGSDPLHVFSWTILNPSRWHHNSWWLIMTLRHKLGYSPSQPNATNRGYIHRCNKKNAATSHFMFSATAIYFKVNKGFSQHCWYCKEATAEFDDPPLDCPKSSNFLWNIIFIFQKKYLVGGIPTPLKDMSQMGRILPNWTESHKIHVPDHQPGIYVCPQVIKHGNRKIHPFRHVFPSETSKSLGDSPAPLAWPCVRLRCFEISGARFGDTNHDPPIRYLWKWVKVPNSLVEGIHKATYIRKPTDN